MSEAKNISNKDLLDELGKRIKEGGIKLYGRELIARTEKDNTYASYILKVDVGYLVNTAIRDLKDEIRLLRAEKGIVS